MNIHFLLFVLTVGSVILDRINVISTISIPQLFSLLFLFIISTVHLAKRRPIKINRSFVLICALLFMFIGLEVLSGLINGVSNGILGLLRSRAISLILFFSASIGTFKYLKNSNLTLTTRFFNIMLLSGIVLILSLLFSSFGVYQLETVVNTPHRYYFPGWMSYRTTGLFMNYGDLSIWLSLITAIALQNYFILDKKVMSIIYLLLLPIGVIATESRNVLLALSATIFVFSWNNSTKNIQETLKKSLLMVSIILVGTVIITEYETLFRIYDDQINLRGRTDSRLEQYIDTINYIKEHPLLGAGPGNLKFLATQVEAGIFEVPVHNIFLQAASRSGVGAIFMLACLVYIGIRLRNGNKQDAIPEFIWPAYIGFIIAIQFYPPLSYGSPVFWLPLGIYASIASQPYPKKPQM